MIKQRNIADWKFNLKQTGSAAVSTNVDSFIAPVDGAIMAVMARFGTVGVDGTGSPTTNVIVDILKNGTSIFTTTKINWAHATPAVAPSSYGDLVTLAPVKALKGDVISIAVTTIYNGTSPTQPINLNVGITYGRTNTPLPAFTVTDAY